MIRMGPGDFVKYAIINQIPNIEHAIIISRGQVTILVRRSTKGTTLETFGLVRLYFYIMITQSPHIEQALLNNRLCMLSIRDREGKNRASATKSIVP
jgi:hypothetical protein